MKRVPIIIWITIITLLVAVALKLFIIPYALVTWDEAGFLMTGYESYAALKSGDITRAIQLASYRFMYPPLQPLVLSALSLPFGYTIETVRTLSLLWFILSGILTYILGSMLDAKRGRVIGFAASLLFVVSPMMMFLGSTTYKEMMGVVFTLLTVVLYVRAFRKKTVWNYLSVSAGLVGLFFVKYQYIVIVVAAMVLEFVIEMIRDRHRARTLLAHLIMFLPLLIVMEIWVFYPFDRLALFINFLTNRSFQYTTGSLTPLGFLLYVPNIIYAIYSISPVIGAALLATLVLSVAFLKQKEIRFLWLLVMINSVLVTIHVENIQSRYIATSVPFLFILCGYFLMRKPIRKYPAAITMGSVALIVILIDVCKFPYNVYAVGTISGTSVAFNQRDYKDTWYNYDKRTWPRAAPWDAKENPSDVVAFVTNTVDATKPIDIVGASSNFSPDYFYLALAQKRASGTNTPLAHGLYVVTLEILPDSRFNTKDHQIVTAGSIVEVRKRQQDPNLVLYHERLFDELGLRVKIFVPK